MKTYILRFRAVDKKNFEELRSGIKSVETRAGTVKYQPIEVGDKMTFVCGDKKFSKIVKSKSHFKSIDDLLKKIPFKKIMPSLNTKAEVVKAYHSYPNYEEKIKKFGILAFELE